MARGSAISAAPARAASVPAQGGRLTLYRLFWLFLLSSFLGDLVETVFWLITRGQLISRSSLLYGPFSLVWGFGAVLLTLVFHKLTDQSAASIFLAGSALGGIYEYICSLLQEWAFGVCFWDYRHLPFNINGRVDLIFCLFWGAAAVAWVRWLYPALCRGVDAIPRPIGRWLAGMMAVFLTVSTVLSAAALWRMGRRHVDIPAANAVEVFLDERYPDSRLKERYRNMKALDEIGWYDSFS